MGNIKAINRFFGGLDFDFITCHSPSGLDTDLSGVVFVLPGVGSWDDGVANLRESGWFEFLQVNYKRCAGVLGICLGMHLLFEESEEGKKLGLGILPGQIRRVNSSGKINIGWKRVYFSLQNFSEPYKFYHVHKFCVSEHSRDHIIARDENAIPVAVKKNHIWGVQFHPEKSHFYGLQFLRQWANQIGT